MAIRRREACELEGHLRDCAFDNFYDQYNRPALDAARQFAQNPVGILAIWGPNGRGKTHLLAAIHNHLRLYGFPVKYFSFPDWTSQLRNTLGDDEGASPEAFYQQASRYPVILIDDLDYADIRRWTREQVFRLFNRRYNNHGQSGTVLAMEVNPNSAAADDMRWLFSRITDERFTCVEMTGPDNRRQVNLLQRLLRARQALLQG